MDEVKGVYKVKDLSLADEGLKQIRWAESRMPVLMALREKYSKTKPFKGFKIAGCLHVTKETAVLIKTFVECGAEVSWSGCNPLSTQDTIAAALAKQGISIFAWNGMSVDEFYWAIEQTLHIKPNLTLDSVQRELEKVGLGLKVWDCYRPLSVQKILWSIVPDERYVANPAKGSRHNRGCAVDLTLVDSLGNELPMPTKYDDFTEKAHRDYYNLPDTVIKNRKILEDVMKKYGFIPLPTEWWHFDAQGWENFSILDIPLKELNKK